MKWIKEGFTTILDEENLTEKLHCYGHQSHIRSPVSWYMRGRKIDAFFFTQTFNLVYLKDQICYNNVSMSTHFS